MSTRKIRNSWWADFRFHGVRYRKRSPDNSRAGGQAYELTLRQRLARGEPLDGSRSETPPTPILSAFVEEWWRTYVLPNNRLSTRIAKEVVLRVHLLPAFGHLPLDGITPELVEKYKAAKVAAGIAPQTVNKHLLVLRKCLQTALDWGRLPALPKFKQLREPPPTFRFLTPEECDRLLAHAAAGRWRTMILVAIRTGMRIGELLGLDWSDVDLENRTLTVRRALVHGELVPPKSNRERHIPLTADACQALAALPHREAFVFRKNNNRPLCAGGAGQALARICRAAGVRPVGWHVLRHTFASHLATRGVSLQWIQALLGHADMRMSLRYAHLAPSALRDAVSVLEAANSGQQAVNVTSTAAQVSPVARPEYGSTEPRIDAPAYRVAA